MLRRCNIVTIIRIHVLWITVRNCCAFHTGSLYKGPLLSLYKYGNTKDGRSRRTEFSHWWIDRRTDARRDGTHELKDGRTDWRTTTRCAWLLVERKKGRADSWTDGQVDGRTGGRTDGTHIQTDGWTDEQTEWRHEQTDGPTDGPSDWRAGGRTDGWMNQMDKPMIGWTCLMDGRTIDWTSEERHGRN